MHASYFEELRLTYHMYQQKGASLVWNLIYLKDTVIDSQNGDIKGATAQIEDQDVLLGALLVQAIGQGSCGGLIDDSGNIQAGNDTCNE